MATEIERKFLVKKYEVLELLPSLKKIDIVQAYLSISPVVRVRVAGERAFLAVKGSGLITRAEYEYEIPRGDAIEMIAIAKSLIEKTRYYYVVGELTWEIDVFRGDNDGLVLAEVELKTETQVFELPTWVSQEVTLDPAYANSSLSTSSRIR